MPTIQDLYDEVIEDLRAVESAHESWVCPACLGPKSEVFDECPGCHRLDAFGAPKEIFSHTVPVSIAVRPGAWYNRLATYKAGHPEFRKHLVSVLAVYLKRNADEVKTLLGGSATMITTVPSKRGRSFDDHPLTRALSMYQPIREKLQPVLGFTPQDGFNYRSTYFPTHFGVSGESPDGHRILLVEDTWVGGATAVSAAGALLDAGASSVVTMPIARVLDVAFWKTRGSAYVPAVDAQPAGHHRVAPWPR